MNGQGGHQVAHPIEFLYFARRKTISHIFCSDIFIQIVKKTHTLQAVKINTKSFEYSLVQ